MTPPLSSPTSATECQYFATRQSLPPEAVPILESHAFQWGETYDAYLVNEGKREYFWLPEWAGVVAFTRRGRCALIVGGLLAPPERRDELLARFLEFAKKKRWNLSFYNIGRPEIDRFKAQGLEISKCGEEPLVNLARTEWRGKPYEWVRRQENYCKRQGVEVEELTERVGEAEYRETIAPQLEMVSATHVAETVHGRELKFFVGSFDPFKLSGRRLFAAWHEGRIVAFVVCNPCVGGEMWAVEIYRKLPDAPRGVVPFVIMHVLRQLKAEGIQYASLSLVPLLRCDPKVHKGNWLFYLITDFWWNRMNWLFDMRGIYHFKSRFRPDYREMFLAAYPKVTIRSMLAIGLVWEIIKFNPFRVLRRRWSKSNRGELATPGFRPERVVREVKRKRKTEQPQKSGQKSEQKSPPAPAPKALPVLPPEASKDAAEQLADQAMAK